jgi:predicted nucleic acid-binding protein
LQLVRVQKTAYIDTSVWCAFAFNEREMPEAALWLAELDLDLAASSAWARTEFYSASQVKVRNKGETQAGVNRAAKAFEAAYAMAHGLRVIEADFEHASQLCREVKNMRAGDALHLAIAMRHGCVALASLDKNMNEAARAAGLELVTFE